MVRSEIKETTGSTIRYARAKLKVSPPRRRVKTVKANADDVGAPSQEHTRLRQCLRDDQIRYPVRSRQTRSFATP